MDTPTCVICHHTLRASEIDRHLCRPCETHTAQQLDELPDLITQLHALLAPHTKTPGPRVTVTREPSAPLDLDILDQITTATNHLDTWVRDWCHHLNWQPPAYRDNPITQATRFLRNNLPWAAENHPAIDDFATEIHDLHHQATLTLDPPERTIPAGTCPTVTKSGTPCGAALRIAPGDTVIHCPRCATTWNPLDLAA